MEYTGRYAASPLLEQRESMPPWVAYLFVFTVFSRELGYMSLGGIDYDLIGYNFFILYFLIRLRNFYFSRSIILGIVFLMAAGVGSKLYLDLQVAPLWKQLIPMLVIFLGTYDFLCRYDYKKIFEIYFQISYYAAILGLIQFGLKLFFGIKFLTGYSQLFLDSIAAEPSHYTVIIMPAVIYGIYYFKELKWKSAVLLLSLILTTSSTAYIVLLTMLLIVYRRAQYLIVIAPVIYFLYTNVLLSYEKFYSRFLGFQKYYENRNFSRIYSATSVSFLTNLEVAFTAIKSNPLFGCGVGGHDELYQRHFQESAFRMSYLYGMNSQSAHSLLIRILSETGIVGFVLYIWGLFKSQLWKADDYHRIISIACLSHFIGKALKLGGYFDYGTPFFALILVFNYWDYKQQKKQQEELVPASE